MKPIEPTDLSELSESYQALLASQQTLLLSTASKQALPDLSYAPFVRDGQGCFTVYLSELAAHARNLLENPQASILFIRPEQESANLFARERAVIACKVQEISRAGDSYQERLQLLQDRFGNVVELLSSLNDFHLFVLQPQSGRYVLGFGKAFDINVADDCVQPLPGIGK